MSKTETKSSESAENRQDKNPENPIDKTVARIEPSIETNKFSATEQKKIVKMVIEDAKADIVAMATWLEDRKLDLQMYEGDRPSKLENLVKKPWQSDRNLGMCAATCDSYQATLLATNWNPDTLSFKDSKENEIDRKDDIAEFAKWGLGRSEADTIQEVDDFIHNRITQGFSVFKVYWKIWYQWVDRRIPVKYTKTDKLPPGRKIGDTKRYDIKTEQIRNEKGLIENIASLEDFLTPAFGKSIQELPHCIHVLHLTGEDLMDYYERGIFINVDEKYIKSLRNACFDYRLKSLGKEKAEQLGLRTPEDITEVDLRDFPIDIYEWYGMYKKNGRMERYRFHVEPTTMTFHAGKPLRKVPGCRTGKYPFVGGAFIRRPGQLRGKSLPRLIMNLMNALNNVFNQKSDFQYVENCPFGFHKPDENFDRQIFDLQPGVSYPSDDPKNVNFPNLSRSMAWAEADERFLLELLERMTGAASYFMSNSQGVSGTATRDAIINEKSETRFGIWVRRIGDDIAEAIDMWVAMYQDCAPPGLAERVIGEDGKKLFPNLSIETLQGNYTAYMAPDIVSGSKTMKKQIFGMAYQMSLASPWFSPQINPRGNWQFTADTFKSMGLLNIEDYMPPKPPANYGEGKEIDKLWAQFSQGEEPDIDMGANIMETAAGLAKKLEKDIYTLDVEYRPNVEAYMIKLSVAMREQLQKAQEQQIANAMAANMIHGINNGTSGSAPAAGGPAGPQAFAPLPNGNVPVVQGVRGVNPPPQDVVVPGPGQ